MKFQKLDEDLVVHCAAKLAARADTLFTAQQSSVLPLVVLLHSTQHAHNVMDCIVGPLAQTRPVKPCVLSTTQLPSLQ